MKHDRECVCRTIELLIETAQKEMVEYEFLTLLKFLKTYINDKEGNYYGKQHYAER